MLSTSEMVVKHSGVPSDGPAMERQKQQREEEMAKLKKYIDEFNLEREKENAIKGKMKKPKYRNNPKFQNVTFLGQMQRTNPQIRLAIVGVASVPK